MSAAGNSAASGRGRNGAPEDLNRTRFLVVSGLFLAYESALIVGFGDYFYSGVVSEAGRSAMVVAAALGYFFLGALGGSRASLPVAILPVLVAWALDNPVPVDASPGDNLPLYQKWILLIYILLPAWLLGLLGSRLVEARRERGVDDPRA